LVFATIVVAASAWGAGATGAQRDAHDWAGERRRMVEEQLEARDIRDARVIDAMLTVPRHLFVPDPQRAQAYADTPLPIGHGQTISQPYIVAFMTQALNVKPGDRVLEIGTGSGYQAAVLGSLAKTVYTMEIVAPLAERARQTLKRLGYRNIEVRTGNGYLGWPEHAPYDRIMVTAAPDEVPTALVQQLKIGGLMAIPVGTVTQELRILRRTATGTETLGTLPVRFVPMTGKPIAALGAAQSAWQPAPGHEQIPIWPNVVPDARPKDGPEVSGTVVDAKGSPRLVAGKPWVYIDRVSQPTMTVYSPEGSKTGAAVVVFPGGGYNVLAIDLEGTEACDWLTSKGVTCVLLKYRVPCAKSGPYRDCLTALEDAQRTVGLVRFHAAEWRIDPHKIGVLGFSAGGHMVAALSTHFEKRLYPAVDAADNESCRPDFAVALYPGHLAVPEKSFALNPDIQVTGQTPPTFLLQAEDDPTDPVENSLVYYAALRKAGVPAEMHVYATGGHAFALRATESPITRWPQLAETWLKTIGIIAR
jgi:protein-L-isoaspartate(D-aspartate) O-methyltransferase